MYLSALVTVARERASTRFPTPRGVSDPSRCKEVATAEIVDCQKNALQVEPPYPGRDVVGRLPYRDRDLPQHRQAVIVVECASVIAGDPMLEELGVVVVEQMPLVAAPVIGEP